MLIGREKEYAKLQSAVLGKESMLIWAPAECGKSVLIDDAIASLPEILRARCLPSRSAGPPHAIWTEFIRALAFGELLQTVRHLLSNESARSVEEIESSLGEIKAALQELAPLEDSERPDSGGNPSSIP